MAMSVIDEGKRTEADATGRTRVAGPSRCGKLQKRLLQRVLDRMKADLAADLDLSTLAAESGYSRSHFLRTFRAAMGSSPHQWLTRLRVERAKTILRENSISLIDIALDCGFSSHAHFSNTFRQIVGVTPSYYRRSHGPHMQKGSLFVSQLSRNAEFASTFHSRLLRPNVRLAGAGNSF
jgi:transcriptional regulator GlxA family with amidase domain